MDAELALIDSHCHLDFSAFDGDRHALLSTMQQQQVLRLHLPGVMASQWPQLAEFCLRYASQLSFSVGLHPYFAAHHRQHHLQLLEQWLQNPPTGLVALGECGLDTALEHADLAQQQQWLAQQLELAKQFDFPLVLHCRKAHPQLQQMLKCNDGVSGVIHAFSGPYPLADSYVQLGMKLGIGGTITYPRGHKTRDAIARLPLSSLVLETDAPDMPLCGFQGRRNSPLQVRRVFAALCAIRKESPAELAAALWQNTQSLFPRWSLGDAC